MHAHNLILHNASVAVPCVDHICRPPAEYGSLTRAQWLYLIGPVDDESPPLPYDRFVPAANRSTVRWDPLVNHISA